MKANEIYEAQKRLIESENVNVSETNVLKSFAEVIIKIALILATVYFGFLVVSGIIISMLNTEQQIKLENFLACFVSLKTVEMQDKDKINIDKIKNKIISLDKKFPKTSNIEIKIHPNEKKNALCLPNGDIYITSSLYEKIKDDEQMLFFVIAHEMGHYRHKDHIMNFRKDIAKNGTLLFVAITAPEKVGTIVSSTMELSDLNYSRGVEARADKYAGKLLLNEYGNVNGAIRALTLLSDKEYPKFLYIFSTHPSIETRMERLKKLK